MSVLVVTSEMLSSLESSATIQLGTKERSVFTLLVGLLNMTLQFLFSLESKLAQLTDEAAAMLPDVDGVLAEILEDQVALQASRFEVVELHAVTLFEVDSQVLSRGKLSITAIGNAFVLLPVRNVFTFVQSRCLHSNCGDSFYALVHMLFECSFGAERR